jgi:dihydroxy-acid dehydratase
MKKLKGDISDEDYKGIIKNSIPGAGACGGMYTANTMSSAIEALGMSLPYSSSNPAVSDDKRIECAQIGQAIENLLVKDIKPRDIMTKRAFENAITLIMALGGSTNAVLHLIAMGRMNRPGILLYGGTVKKGKWKGEDLNIVSAFEAYDDCNRKDTWRKS